MKKVLSLLVICLVLGGGGFYVWATQFKDGFSLSEGIKVSEGSKGKITLPASIHSQTILLQNITTGETIVEKNKNKQVEIASLTKLITVYLLLESAPSVETKVTIEQRIIDNLTNEGASLSGFKSGDELTIEDLAYGIVLPSGGDAALTAANYIAGSEKKFVAKMNELAKEIGMENTHFKNSIGLDAKNHYSTAEDLSKFMNVALKNEHFNQLMTTTTYQTAGTMYTPEGYYIESTMLKDSSDLNLSKGEILGGKTGYTKKAGQCLISLARIQEEYYLLITTGADGNPLTDQLNMEDARYIYETID